MVLQRGQSASHFIQSLQAENKLSKYSALHLKLYFRLTAIDDALKAGEYQVSAESRPAQFIKQLREGEVVRYKVTLIEGWTFKQIRAALSNLPSLESKFTDLDEKQIMTLLGQPNSAAEGRFFPDTYFYTKGFSDKELLLRAMNKMDKHLAQLWSTRHKWITLKTPYEGLVLASLIEKEAGWVGERPMISGVLHNRLKKKMLLQCDPTIIYGLGAEYSGDITRDDLKKDTPYNTYIHKGLPPTPIAAPGLSALEAAFQPEETDALFFVSNGDGSHRFSQTLKAHTKAVDLLYEGVTNE